MTRVYQAVLHGSGEHLGPALRRSFTAASGVPDDGSPALRHAADGESVVLDEGPACGRYTVGGLSALWGPSSPTPSPASPTPSPPTAWAVISVDATALEAADLSRAVATVSGLLDAERAFDGAIPLETSPLDVDTDHVAELLGRLLDPRRRVPVVVLSTDEHDASLPASHAAYLARRLAGTAVVARLCDKAAQDRLNAALGPGFGVYGGALRTYMAEFDPATEDYPQRHPVRSGSALRDHGKAALDVVVTGVTGDGVRRPLPPDARRGMRLVPQILDRGLDWRDVLVHPGTPPGRTGVAARGAAPTPLLPRRLGPPAGSGTDPNPRTAPDPGSDGNDSGTRNGGTCVPLRPGDLAAVVRRNASARLTGVVPPADGPRPGDTAPVSPTQAAKVNGSSQTHASPANGTDSGGPPPGSPTTAGPGSPDKSGPHWVPGTPVPEPPAAWVAEVARQVVGELAQATEARKALAELAELVRDLRGVADSLGLPRRDAAESEALAAELSRLRYDYDLLVLQYEELAEESRRSDDRIRRLDGLLAERPIDHPAPTDDMWTPECLADVLLRARTELHHVSLPHALDAGASVLDKGEPGHTRVWAGAAWDALRALNAYAAARSANTFRGGFRDWCRNPPHGAYALSPKKFAMKESDAVAGRAKFRRARTFPVPPEVAPEQAVFMEAHVKLRGIGNPAPRMHFHDDAAGVTGRIHIGYLGHHLDNTRTN
ncbi:hypothetical protein [Yinghuangia sp. YIM S09857]|uniref:hypothetical protein n=1 Tax=Yinghuangia sp. YIM S09857 TaxID=3436929 RepID=UPI003F5315CF